jgi:hypothetical protein
VKFLKQSNGKETKRQFKQSNLITIMTKTDYEEEISLPKRNPQVLRAKRIVTVVRMAQELLPKGINLSKDTHDLILACALEFIQLLTFQANEICQKQTRNGFIGLQHVVKACEELGFHEYVYEIEAVTAIYDQQLKLMQRVNTFQSEVLTW